MATLEHLNHTERPQYFYKYWSLCSPEDFIHLKDLLEKREIFFQDPTKFNDPFECAPYLLLPQDDEELIHHFSRRYERLDNFTTGQSQVAAREALSGIKKDCIPEKFQKKVAQHFSMLCLTEKKDCHLMWAHYADMHKGICLEFDANSSFFQQGTHKVEYQLKRPELDWIRRSTWSDEEWNNAMSATLLTKAKQWKYEEEWRKVRSKQKGVEVFPREALTRIILGERISLHDEQTIKGMCSKLKAPITKAKLSEKTYQISID